MKILFLGYAINEKDIQNIIGSSVAGNKMQLNILENLSSYSDIEIHILTIYPIASYAKSKKIYINRKNLNISDRLTALRVPFLNVSIVKQIWQVVSLYREGKKYLKDNKDVLLFTFNMFPQVGIPAKWLKKFFKCKIVTLLADLPVDFVDNRRGLNKLLRSIYYKITKNNINFCDQIIVLNKKASEIYAPSTNSIVVEGGINVENISNYDKRKHIKTNKSILYGGFLTEYNGIKNLVDAMFFIQDNQVTLDIYGEGPLEKYVIENAKKDKRIVYHGKVNNKEMIKLQKEAFLLINPRNPEYFISQVTFPSKIFEYLASGTPILSTLLNCFTEEYLDKMFFVENNKSEILAKAIEKILKKDQKELDELAYRAREFVFKEKSWKKQTQKIYLFLKSTYKEGYFDEKE